MTPPAQRNNSLQLPAAHAAQVANPSVLPLSHHRAGCRPLLHHKCVNAERGQRRARPCSFGKKQETVHVTLCCTLTPSAGAGNEAQGQHRAAQTGAATKSTCACPPRGCVSPLLLCVTPPSSHPVQCTCGALEQRHCIWALCARGCSTTRNLREGALLKPLHPIITKAHWSLEI